MGRAVAALVLVWALGTLLGEGLTQAGAAGVLLLAAVRWRQGRDALPADLRRFALLTLLLAGWQALSPLVAFAAGVSAGLPRAARWTQALDTLATLGLALVAPGNVPWRALGWLLGVGWGLELAVGAFQAWGTWPWERLGPWHFPMNRLREEFPTGNGGSRHAGLGLLFHRLRYAHGAVAALGPAVALALRSGGRLRLVGGAGVAVLLACAWLSFARAALAAGLVVVLAGLLLLLPGRRRASALGFGVLAALALAASPAWRQRVAEGWVTFASGERGLALATGWELAKAHPVLGVGFGNYAAAAKPICHYEWSSVICTSAHNLLLTAWAETGLVGLALLLAQQVALALALFRRGRAGSLAALGGLLALLGYHVVGLGHHVPFHSGVMLSFALAFGLGLAGSRSA